MIKFFIDINIIIDFLSERQEFGVKAKKIFNLADKNKILLFTTSQSIITSHYILKKIFSEEEVRNALSEMMEIVEVISVDHIRIKESLKSDYKDFEDAVQIFCAYEIENLTGIITRDLKDFSKSKIKIFSPEEALNYVQ